MRKKENSTMRPGLFTLIFISCFLFSNTSYGNHNLSHSQTDKSTEEGVRVTLKISTPGLVASLASKTGMTEFSGPFNMAVYRFNNGEENFIDLFVEEFKAQNSDTLLAPFFYQKSDHEITGNTENPEVITWLNLKKLEATDHVMIVIKARIEALGLKKQQILIQPSTGHITIELPKVSPDASTVSTILAQGNLGFFEVYDNKENGIAGIILMNEKRFGNENESMDVAPSDTLVDSQRQVSSLLKLAFEHNEEGEIIGYKEGSVIGYAKIKDTADLNFMLNHVILKKDLPLDLKFVWNAKGVKVQGEETDILALHAIKAPHDGPKVSSRDILNASISKDPIGEKNINLEMNDIGARKWEEMTTDNLGKQIAIVMDDLVLAAPIVMSVMEKSSSISGNFSQEEMNEFVALINSAPLPVPIKIIQIEKL